MEGGHNTLTPRCILNKENVEMLAVLINCGNEKQLVVVFQMAFNKGCTQAKAVYF